MKKRYTILAAVLVIPFMLAACMPGFKAQKTELNVQRAGTPDTIDPAMVSSIDGGNMIMHMFEGLLKTDINDRIEGGIAQSWEVSEDGLTYTFHLKENLKWSDGTPLTADDIVYSWKRMTNPKLAAPYAYDLLNYLEGWEEASDKNSPNPDALGVSAPNPYTFVAKLSMPCNHFLSICAFPVLSPVKKEAVEGSADWTASPDTYISNGPYKLAKYEPGGTLVMEKNKYYTDYNNITFERIVWHLIDNSRTAFEMYQEGKLDFCYGIPVEEIPGLTFDKEYHVEPKMGSYYFTFNLKKRPFDDKRVRRAFSLAINRREITQMIMLDSLTPLTNFIGEGVSDYKPGSSFAKTTQKTYGDTFHIDDFEQDLKEAKELLAEAGYPNGSDFPRVVLLSDNAEYNKSVAEYIQRSLHDELGVDIKLDIRAWGEAFKARRNGKFAIARDGWVYDWNDPMNILGTLESGNGNNTGWYSNPEYDRLIVNAKKTTDRQEYFKLLHEAEQVVLNDAAIAPIAGYSDQWLQKESLKNIWHSSSGNWWFMYGKMY